jgi:hypothetical protein
MRRPDYVPEHYRRARTEQEIERLWLAFVVGTWLVVLVAVTVLAILLIARPDARAEFVDLPAASFSVS